MSSPVHAVIPCQRCATTGVEPTLDVACTTCNGFGYRGVCANGVVIALLKDHDVA